LSSCHHHRPRTGRGPGLWKPDAVGACTAPRPRRLLRSSPSGSSFLSLYLVCCPPVTVGTLPSSPNRARNRPWNCRHPLPFIHVLIVDPPHQGFPTSHWALSVIVGPPSPALSSIDSCWAPFAFVVLPSSLSGIPTQALGSVHGRWAPFAVVGLCCWAVLHWSPVPRHCHHRRTQAPSCYHRGTLTFSDNRETGKRQGLVCMKGYISIIVWVIGNLPRGPCLLALPQRACHQYHPWQQFPTHLGPFF